MKELFELFEKDIQSENFTRRECILGGIVYPLAFITFAVVAPAIIEWLLSAI